jgi:ribose/xylose/arabinose/galactoside ABC-type transport system permease subunit
MSGSALTETPQEPVARIMSAPAKSHAIRDRLGLRRAAGLLIAIAIVYILITLIAPPNTFASYRNMTGLMRAMSTMSLIALGTSLVIIVGEIDLSFGFVYGLSAMTVAVFWLVLGWPVPLAVAAAIAMAVAVGSFNALLTVALGIPSFIATLGSGTFIFGMTLFISGARSYSLSAAARTVDPAIIAAFQSISVTKLPFGLMPQGVWMLLFAALFIYILDLSLYGFRLKAIGGNPKAAKLAGLPVGRYKWSAFVASSVMAAIAAILDFAFIAVAQPDAGQTLMFPVFAAVIIGGASLVGGKGSTVGTLAGALLLSILANAFAILALGAHVQQFFLGGVTILAVAIDRFAAGRAGRRL